MYTTLTGMFCFCFYYVLFICLFICFDFSFFFLYVLFRVVLCCFVLFWFFFFLLLLLFLPFFNNIFSCISTCVLVKILRIEWLNRKLNQKQMETMVTVWRKRFQVAFCWLFDNVQECFLSTHDTKMHKVMIEYYWKGRRYLSVISKHLVKVSIPPCHEWWQLRFLWVNNGECEGFYIKDFLRP